MVPSADSDESSGTSRPAGGRYATADRAASDRGRLRASEAAVAHEVIELQLARQRLDLDLPDHVEPLSPREREVLVLVAGGRSDGEIASALFISKKTASVHVANIKGKLGAASRIEIALIAARLGLLSEADPPTGGAPTPSIPPRSSIVCPFKGLASFEVADARYFFGRERLVADMVARLAGSTFLGVVGPSGSGKSSVLRAGLLPALADGVLPGSDEWTQVLLRPGTSPATRLTESIQRATAASDTRLLIVVDQFEEVFTLCQDEAERLAFIGDLVTLARDSDHRALVVIAVRADFYGRCAVHPDLAALLSREHVLVGPMTAEEVARAIESPARAAGLRVEPALIDALVADVVGQPGGLPMLSATLVDLWRMRDGRLLRLEAYERIGGVRGAVSRLAEASYARLTAAQQDVARGVFIRLSTSGEDGLVVRRPVATEEFAAEQDPTVRAVLEVLTEDRLLTVNDGVIEIAHESVLRDWPRLTEWLESDREGRRIREHLAREARTWDDGGRDAGDLLRGARLAAAVDWAEHHAVELTGRERGFLAASRDAGEREVRRTRATNRRLRGLFAATALLLVVALAAGGLAVANLGRAEQEAARAAQAAELAEQEAARAEQEATRAEREAAIARARELAAGAISVLDDDPSLSKLLAIAAASIADPPLSSISALHRAVALDRIVGRYTWPAEHKVYQLWTDLHPSGRYLVAGGAGGAPSTHLEMVDLTDGSVIWTFDVDPGAAIETPRFADGGDVVVASLFHEADPPANQAVQPGVWTWDAMTGRVLRHYPLGPCGGWAQGISADHLLVRRLPDTPTGCFRVAAQSTVSLELIDRATGASTFVAESVGVTSAALSGDGRTVAYDDGGVVTTFDVGSGARRPRFASTGVASGHRSIRALNHDGSLLLFGDRPMSVWSVDEGTQVAILDEAAGESWSAIFGSDGTTAYTSGRDGSVRIWDAMSGEQRAVFPSVGSGSVSPLPDGRILVANQDSPSAVVIDTATIGEAGGIETCAGFTTALGSRRAGSSAVMNAVCGDDSTPTTFVLDLAERRVLDRLPNGEAQLAEISPDGTQLVRQEAIIEPDHHWITPLVIRDIRTGQRVMSLEGLCTWDLVFVEAGRGSRSETGDCRPYPDRPFALWAFQIRWSPDGRMIAAQDHGSDDGYLAVWDARTGRLLHTRPKDATYNTVPNDLLFSPDSSELILAYNATTTRIRLSTETWETLAADPGGEGLDGGASPGFVGWGPDGTIVGVGGLGGLGTGALHWYDPTTLEVIEQRSRSEVHDGSIKSVAMSPDRTTFATGASDGFVRVWDSVTGDLLHEVPFGKTQIQSLAYVDDRHLAVGPQEGHVYIVTTDTEELLAIARRSLTRGFTDSECRRYEFGDECPTLEELRTGE